MINLILDKVIEDPDQYVKDILKLKFQDVQDGEKLFKGIQIRKNDELQSKIEKSYPDYYVTYNFVRQSPLNQIEPNFVHTDEMMGDKTVLLYLNKENPPGAGTTLYDYDNPMCIFFAKYNRLVIFDSNIPHSRNIFENFGTGSSSRLLQVMFLKKKV
jgi:hypothetical protein|tara:strand:+ start:2573 stop:3043 length:471 start_codon:yes stop_codon:yes gene_type:complete